MRDYKDNLKRYDLSQGYFCGAMKECKDGDYVFYDDARREIENCLKVIVELTHEKYQALCDVDKLQEFAQLVKDCPENATHLMPIAADALLAQQLHTESVGSEED